MIENKSLMVLAIACCLTGCTMAPRYTRPEPPIPSQWPTGQAYVNIGGKTEQSVSDVRWRDFYTDEQMQKIILLALDNNRDLRVAASNIEKAHALYRIQRAELFPAINASGSMSQQRVPADTSTTGEGYTAEQYSAGIGVSSWEVDFFGRIRSLKDAALEQYLATEQGFRSARISLAASVASAYLTYAADSESLKYVKSTLEAQQATYGMIQRRFDVGVSSKLDLSQARTRLEAARADVALYTRLVALDKNALDLLAGTPVPSELLPDQLSTITPPKDISAGLSSEVLLNRPDVLQAENLLKSANASIGAARAAFFPRIALTSSIGTISGQLSDLFKAGSQTWLFNPQVSLPIFDAGERRANLKAAEVDRDIYLARYEKTIQTAFKETADALAYRGTLGDQIEAQEALVQASTEAYRLSDARYTKGIDSYLGVLDAQRSLYTAEQGLISLRLARLTNLVTLYKVLGGE